MRPAALLALAAAALTAACQHESVEAPPAAQADPVLAGLPLPQPGAPSNTRLRPPPNPNSGPAPHIYMAVQDEGEGKPVSVIFAIDAARDNTPSDDPAVRLTPDGGQCNPQEMTRYDFPPGYAEKPVFSDAELAAGVGAADLPDFMAIAVSADMIQRGLAATPDETHAQNVCTRKLWERLVLAESRPAEAEPAPAGQ